MLIKVKNKIAEIDFIGNENYQIKLYVKQWKTPNKKKNFSYTESIEIHKGKIQNRFRESDCLTKKKYRDARILSDTITYLKDENALSIKINVEEGNKYYFGDIKFYRKHCLFKQLLVELG
jgi:outer membrane protein insertion porin family